MNLSTFTEPQRRSVEHLEGPLLICAGAGSGKTFTLTQRIAYALLPGSGEAGAPFLRSIEEALVITFTEKAAGEIKERVRSTLRAEGMLDEALKVDAAWISTIHGMCSRILREHALEIGLDPNFSVLSSTQEEELRMMAIEAVLARTAADGSPYHDLFEHFNSADIKTALENILSKAHTLPAGLKAVDLGPKGTPVPTLARAVLEMAEHPEEGGTEGFYAAAATLAQQLRDVFDAGASPFAFDEVDLGLRPFTCKAAAGLKEAMRTLAQARTIAPYREAAELLVQLAREVEAEYDRFLAAEGQVDMAGLIRKTLTAFDDFPQIAAQYTNRFALIMVDEFQDTSQLQIDMIERIAGKARQRLCTVGDAQQSIYRFQGADVSVYFKHKRDMQESGAQLVQLDDNFRSNGDILAFVRAVCGQDGYFQEPFLDLRAAKEGKPYHGSGPRVEIALAPHNRFNKENPVKAGDARVAEAQHFAKRFKELHSAGHAYSDMVVLLGRMSHAQTYAQALREEGMPCIVAGGSKYFESPHVKTCLALLGALANPFDAECLLTVLTSDILPVSTDDLLFLSTYAADEGGYPKRQNLARGLLSSEDVGNPSKLLSHARNVLEHAWAKLGTVRPAQLFKETVIDSGWLARLEAGDASDQAIAADVLKFVRLVEDAQSETGFDMARVVREMRNRSLVAGEKPGALSVENLDAVRIMTIHSSKGLEFPVVAVADCFESNARGGKVAMLSEEGTLYLSLAASGSKSGLVASGAGVKGASEPDEFRANILATNDNREYEEKKRLFYVAATRASAALIVGLSVSCTNTGYPNLVQEILCGLLPGETDFPAADAEIDYGGSQPLRFSRLAIEPSQEVVATEAHPDSILVPAVVETNPPSIVPLTERSDFFSYSSLAKSKRAEQQSTQENQRPKPTVFSLPDSDDGLTPTEPARTPSTSDADKATDFGSALHRACEWLALQSEEPNPSTVAAALDRAATEFGVRDRERLQSAFDRWAGSNAHAWAKSFTMQQPELPFVVRKDDGILEGEIDLFCTTGLKAGIIDYKTGGHANETPEQLHEKHLLQAECYAYAALQAGYTEVELRFVRVEQEDPAKPGQPQVVSYFFSA